MPLENIETLSLNYPILFFPVRIETRYVTINPETGINGRELWVRIYPDSLLVDTHEPRLSPNEKAAGEQYWKTTFSSYDLQKEKEAWLTLIGLYKTPRATWIVRQTQPLNYQKFADYRSQLNPPIDKVKPEFPSDKNIPSRPENIRKKVQADLLPDFWAVYSSTSLLGTSKAIQKPVVLSTNWQASREEQAKWKQLPNDVVIDPDAKWVYDFEMAVEIGMGIKIPSPNDSYSRLIIFGINTSLSPQQTATQLESLIESHHYSRGFEFLSQGTPTNNTEEVSSAYPPPDPKGEKSFEVERIGQSLNSSSAGVRMANSLGVNSDIFMHSRGADMDEQSSAKAMAEVLFPITMGYAFRETPEKASSLHNSFRDSWADNMYKSEIWHYHFDSRNSDYISYNEIYDYFTNHVRGRGHHTVFRVGSNPYGLLPITHISMDNISFNRYESNSFDKKITRTLNILLNEMEDYRSFVAQKKEILFNEDPFAYFLDKINLSASAREVYFRNMDKVKYVREPIPGSSPPRFRFREIYAFEGPNPKRYTAGLVNFKIDDEELLSESNPLPTERNYLHWLFRASFKELINESYPDVSDENLALLEKPPFLYFLLWQALLTEYIRAAVEIYNLSHPDESPKDEDIFFRLRSTGTSSNSLENIYDYLNETTNTFGTDFNDVPLEYYITPYFPFPFRSPFKPWNQLPDRIREIQDNLGSFRSSISLLSKLPTAELERLFTETLDTCSYRVDAWVTAMANRYLQQSRSENPQGCYFGAFGWVENLHRKSSQERVEVEGEEDVYASSNNQGFIFSPSMQHANTSAVLRNAFLVQGGKDNSAFNLNLSSERVRKALWIIDSVRYGSPLGASLGYLFERALHDARLDQFIDDFREYCPLVASKAVQSDAPNSTMAARNVVDGYQLMLKWQDRNNNSFPSKLNQSELIPYLDLLEDALDAVSDLLIAESVHQMIGGNTTSALAALQAISKGKKPPSPDFIKTPRSGKTVLYRVGLSFTDSPPTNDPWTAKGSPRSLAAPELNNWISQILGNPDQIIASVWLEGQEQVQKINLRKLQLEPLDLLNFCKDYEPGRSLPHLEDQIFWSLNQERQRNEAFKITQIAYSRSGSELGGISFEDLFTVLQTIREVLTISRPLLPEDLISSENTSPLELKEVSREMNNQMQEHVREFQARFNQLKTKLIDNGTEQFLENPDSNQLFDKLLPLLQYNHKTGDRVIRSYFQEESIEFIKEAQDLYRELRSTIEKVIELKEGLEQARTNNGLNPDKEIQSITKIGKLLFGEEFMVLPKFSTSRLTDFQDAVKNPPKLILGNEYPENDAEWQYHKWLDQNALIHKGIGAWRELEVLSQAIGNLPSFPTITQYTSTPLSTWIGNTRLESSKSKFPNRTESNLIYQFPNSAPPNEGELWSGLVLDEWTEKIPNAEEELGIAYHFDGPNSEAPQTALLAVPPMVNIPEEQLNWTPDLIIKTLSQTFDLAVLRSSDGEYTNPDNGKVRNVIYDARRPLFPMIYSHPYYHAPFGKQERRIKDLEDSLTDDINSQ